MRSQLLPALLLTVSATALPAGAVRAEQSLIRDFTIDRLAAPHPESAQTASQRLRTAPDGLPAADAAQVADFEFYPVAGILGQDVLVPFFVDLQPGPGIRDYNCRQFTFEGHLGHDPYIRSFREMEIGFPVFAAQDGVVGETHDGEEDHNTSNDPQAIANFVVINHDRAHTSQYFHLKKGSVRVKRGDFVTAGTQIGEIGSSGQSIGPHLHFEAIANSVAYEPLSGPCRPGDSNFEVQPQMLLDPVVMGLALGNQPFSAFRRAPYDDAPRTGTFVKGPQRVNFKMEIASVPANSTYTMTVVPPNNNSFAAGSGRLSGYEVDLASFGFGMDLDLYVTGTWHFLLNIEGRQVARIPFTVVNSQSEVVNRPPNPISASLQPVGVRSNEVAVCRVEGQLIGDPDFDVVQYRYEWRVGDQVVRTVTSAARSDALAREFVRGGTTLTCNITASDGNLSAQTATTHATVGESARRRAARR